MAPSENEFDTPDLQVVEEENNTHGGQVLARQLRNNGIWQGLKPEDREFRVL